MGLGLGIFLIVVGLVLVSGVINADTSLIDLATLGWILLGAGLLSIVLALIMWSVLSPVYDVLGKLKL